MSFGLLTEDVPETPLAQIVPEKWKNIPVCLASAIRLLTDTLAGLDKRHDDLVKAVDEQKKKT